MTSIVSYHNHVGDPCSKCGMPARRHRVDHSIENCPPGCKAKHRADRAAPNRSRYSLGIDGEGQGRAPHRYILLAAADEEGHYHDSVENPEGLSTPECLEFILRQPARARMFAFGFGYDLSMILRDVDDETLYRLFRPELRQRQPDQQHKGPFPVKWREYWLNLQGSKFSVGKTKTRRNGNRYRRYKTVWDIWKFYGTSFVNALEKWDLATPEELSEMRRMKNLRSEFDKLSIDEIRPYCFSEVTKIAALASRLQDAHDEAGLSLGRTFYGAGSTASVMLKQLGIREHKRDTPEEMREAVASAFFGGRFEHSMIGAVKKPVYGYDISSAYPYIIHSLPCLNHGRWTLTKSRARAEKARAACVRYSLSAPKKTLSWGPFPFREKDGTICFPRRSGGGWVWQSEFFAAQKSFQHIRFKEAWVYETDCDCKPFSKIPEWYLERLRLSKEGRGIVIKLGLNSIYGKLAQSLGGSPPFQCWIWAGMITAGTRAQLTELMALHADRRNVLAVATDGLYSTEKHAMLPKPRFTGTGILIHDKSRPLGGWEFKPYRKGAFFVRPGIYFPLGESIPDLKLPEHVRARGIGKLKMIERRKQIQEAFESGEKEFLFEVPRFFGAKTSISKSRKGYTRAERFATWGEPGMKLSFAPMPKRAKVMADGKSLSLRSIPLRTTSAPYSKSMMSPDRIAAIESNNVYFEQPDSQDGEFIDYDE